MRLTLSEVVDGYDLVPGATRTHFGGGDLSARVMAAERGGPFLGEAHLLLGINTLFPGAPRPHPPAPSLFRAWDLESLSTWGRRTTAGAELDRLSLSWEGPGVRVTAGRFALTWGEGWFFNPFDLFGAFPLTAVDRSWKPGIDGAAATVAVGEFSEAVLAVLPVTGEREGSAAGRVVFPAGEASLSLTAGKLVDDEVAGAGASADLAGSKIYLQALLTRPEVEGGFWQWVAGWERQTGPQTHLLLELYGNGWGTGEPSGYPVRLASPRYLSGRIPVIGRRELAAEGTLQLTPLVTWGAGGVFNLDDGSTLAHLALTCSLSDYADLKGVAFVGLGRRPQGGLPMSEFGSSPAEGTVELAVSF